MFGDHIPSITMQKGCAMCSIAPHARQDYSDHVLAEMLNKRCQCDIQGGPHTMDCCFLIHCNPFLIIQGHMKSAGRDQHLTDNKLITGCCFLDVQW